MKEPGPPPMTPRRRRRPSRAMVVLMNAPPSDFLDVEPAPFARRADDAVDDALDLPSLAEIGREGGAAGQRLDQRPHLDRLDVVESELVAGRRHELLEVAVGRPGEDLLEALAIGLLPGD